MTTNADATNEQVDARQKILVADDEASIRRILETRLKMIGYDVFVAADGEEAINEFNKINPDLVILDVKAVEDEEYTQITGQKIDMFKNFLSVCQNMNKIRIPGLR